VLANLLPGLRDLRAPLAAGFIWLLFAWLLLEPRYSDWDKTDTPTGAILALRETLTPVAFAGVVSFVAYLIGSISETLSHQAPRLLRRVRGPLSRHRAEDRVFDLRMRFLPIVFVWLVGKRAAAERVELEKDEIGQLIESDLRQTAQRRFTYDRSIDVDENIVDKRLSGSILAFEQIGVAFEGATEDGSTKDVLPPALAVTRQVTRELDVVADNLLDEKSDLFGPIDRLQSEAELRRAILVPVAALAVLLAIQNNIIWLTAGIVMCAALLYDAQAKEAAKLDRLQAALTRTPARSPTIARLDRLIDARLEAAKAEQESRNKARQDAEWFAGERRGVTEQGAH
jgi:hypothetical protein